MARPCDTCQHPQRDEIDAALVAGVPTPELTAKYREISEDSLLRHKQSHLPEKLVRAHQAQELSAATELLYRALRYERRAQRIMDTAEEQGDLGMALRAITTARNTLALLVKMRETYELERRLEALEDEIEKANRRKGRGYAI